MALRKRFRSAITGRFVSKDEADRKPRTTVSEVVKYVRTIFKKK